MSFVFFLNKQNLVSGMNHTQHRWATWIIRPLSFVLKLNRLHKPNTSCLETFWLATKHLESKNYGWKVIRKKVFVFCCRAMKSAYSCNTANMFSSTLSICNNTCLQPLSFIYIKLVIVLFSLEWWLRHPAKSFPLVQCFTLHCLSLVAQAHR